MIRWSFHFWKELCAMSLKSPDISPFSAVLGGATRSRPSLAACGLALEVQGQYLPLFSAPTMTFPPPFLQSPLVFSGPRWYELNWDPLVDIVHMDLCVHQPCLKMLAACVCIRFFFFFAGTLFRLTKRTPSCSDTTQTGPITLP